MGELILGIESSCDETAAAVVRGGREVLSSRVHSQIDEHARYGGVVPEIAGRSHLEKILPVIDAALAFAIIGRPDVVCHSEVARRRGDDLPAVRDLKGILAQGILPLQSRKGGGEDEDESGDEE